MATGFEIEGRIQSLMSAQSGHSARGDWARQDFLLEIQDGNFPATLCFSVWGVDRVKELGSFAPGDNVKVSFNIASREYGNRWYTDLRAWRIVRAGGTQDSRPLPPPPQVEDIPSADDLPAAEDFGEDLPF